jgi:small-conductance mechanosensitive channel
MVVGRPDTVLPGWVGSCLVTVMVIYWTTGLFRVSGLLLVSASQDESHIVKSRTLPFFQMGAKGLIVGLSIYAVFLAWNLDLTAWLASAGIVGIAVGFGAKDTLANLFAGIAIMADAPYRLGDFVSLATGERGRVTEIGLRSTRILTLDDVQIVVPNGNMASSLVVNESGGPRLETRVGVTVGVAYGSDVDRVREILTEEASAASYVTSWPKAVVLFEEMGDSALLFKVLAWLDHPRNRQLAIDALNTRIYKRLQAEGIEIPYPKRDVYIHEAPKKET